MRRRLHFSATLALLLLAVLALVRHLSAQRIRPPDDPPTAIAVRRNVITEPEDRSPGVFTYHNDWARTGQNLTETTLTPANVSAARFGRLKTDFALDGLVYGQPLFAPGITTAGGTYDLVFVATEHDTVYAFDADPDRHPQNWASPIWRRSLLPAGARPAPSSENSDAVGVCPDLVPEVGVTSTPVIDPKTNTMYVVAKMKDASDRTVFTLHALDLRTGLEQTSQGSPIEIDAAIPGRGDPLVPEPGGDGMIHFNAVRANQRAALALVDGIVYVGFASFCDQLPYHGWLLGYDTRQQLAQVVAFSTSPNGAYGGIWASGAAPAIDASGNMFLQVGNGPFDPALRNWGETFLKLPVDRRTVVDQKGFFVLDYFEPFNPEFLFVNDLDLGSSGVVLLPDQAGAHPHLMLGGSKQGLLYVLDRDRLTAGDVHQASCSDAELRALVASHAATARIWTDSCDPVVQVFKNAPGDDPTALASEYRGRGLFSAPSYWRGHVYLAASGDHLKMFEVTGDGIANTPVSASATVFPYPGSTTSISANGDGDGIVWAVEAGAVTHTAAVLYAFDAGDLSHVLYKSAGNADDRRLGLAPQGDVDAMTTGIKFTVPTVYNGRVFVATRGQLNVFGLR